MGITMGKTILTSQVAEILGVSPQRVSQLCRFGRIYGAVKIGRDWHIPVKSIPEISSRKNGRPKRMDDHA
jgi:hypothetical protein